MYSGLAISTGVRGKKSIAPAQSILGALDHDFDTRGCIIPSVCLHVDLPDVISSFYRGQVHVTLKDAVFQASSPFRHAVETARILESGEVIKPIIVLYSDGGGDHTVKFNSVKLSLVGLFRRLDLDMLVACRTCPGNSWANVAERVMSLLNIAYQNVALSRNHIPAVFEQLARRCSNMAQLRTTAQKNKGFREAWVQAVQDVIGIVGDRQERMALKGQKFLTHEAASDEEIAEFTQHV